ncbi:MAG: hypothetical protein EOP21_09400, partial [Hyphomicrobiales bacterium]
MAAKSERERSGAVARYLKALQAGESQGEGASDVRSACLRAGLIVQDSGLLSITDTGRAWLARHDHHQSGETVVGDFRAQHLDLSRATIMANDTPHDVLVNDAES